MINGAHVLLFTPDAEADREFLRDVLGFASVDAGHGWLIFKLPPAEAAVHPTEGEVEPGSDARAELYLMSDDLTGDIESLRAEGVECAEVTDVGWGLLTTFALPSGSRLGMYEPRHPTALEL